MANIEKRTDKKGKVTYRARVRLKGYPEESATLSSLTKAKAWAQETEVKMRDGRHLKQAEAKKHTLGKLVDEYEKRCLGGKKTEKELRQKLSFWRDQIGSRFLIDVTPAVIQECMNKLSDSGKKNATVNRYVQAISPVFKYGVMTLGWIDDTPMRKIRKLKEPRGIVRYLSDEERTALLDACKQDPHPLIYPAVLLAMSTGMRKMEQMTLQWPQVDLQTGRIIILDTKNGERRYSVASGPALEELRKLSKVRRIGDDLVFPGAVRGHPFDIKKPWARVLKAAGIDEFRWHDLRHTFASYLAMSGASLPELADALGHKTLQMVQRYSHLSEDHISSVVERMTSRVFGNA